ncbi:hypothetical protein [Halapricum desulfuricans]|uniref:RCK C-terminal domain-containing protein n=1 Tax=Halapricum desulfuricans TaxID=2841257 RepID=A0A897N7Y6_9EURY|nr:hypothetical protein [Halapricum desulfuricans]QSG08644.1 hypothetical protein HSR122_1246 [Halapricum desulfuricans]
MRQVGRAAPDDFDPDFEVGPDDRLLVAGSDDALDAFETAMP